MYLSPRLALNRDVHQMCLQNKTMVIFCIFFDSESVLNTARSNGTKVGCTHLTPQQGTQLFFLCPAVTQTTYAVLSMKSHCGCNYY